MLSDKLSHVYSNVEGNGTPLQYSCLENPMDGGAWWAAAHGVAKSRTRLSDLAAAAATYSKRNSKTEEMYGRVQLIHFAIQ